MLTSHRLSSKKGSFPRSDQPSAETGGLDLDVLTSLAPGLLAVIISPTAAVPSLDGLPRSSVIGYLVDCAPRLLNGNLDAGLFLGLAKMLRQANAVEGLLIDRAISLGCSPGESRRLSKTLALATDPTRYDAERHFPSVESLREAESTMSRVIPVTVRDLLGF